MFGLGDALPLSLTIDTPYQVVGGAPKFTLIGAPPGATIFWSSYKDGVATSEFNSDYGQTVEANGTAQLNGGIWTDADKGSWDHVYLEFYDWTAWRWTALDPTADGHTGVVAEIGWRQPLPQRGREMVYEV